MFERIISNVLVRLLGDYIEDIDSKSLDIGIWKGALELNNLRLKRTALDMFDLPFCVVHGYVGNITAKIPWRNLGTAPVSAQISDVFVVVQPKKNVKYNYQVEKEKELYIKRKKVENYESVRQLKSTAKKASASMSTPTGESFLTRLTETIINNLQVKISKVHVRYEDVNDPKMDPVIFGLTIDALDLVSTDANWQATFIKVCKQIHVLIIIRN
jgi:vacuolar protein sorting-associated protein 13A/C